MKQSFLHPLSFHTIRFFLIHVWQLLGLLFFGWDPYAVVVMWTFEIYIMLFFEVWLFARVQRASGKKWALWYIMAFLGYWVTFGIAMGVFGIYLLSPATDLDIVGMSWGDMVPPLLYVGASFWYMLLFIVYDYSVNFRATLKQKKDRSDMSLFGGRTMGYTLGYGVCYLLAGAFLGIFFEHKEEMVVSQFSSVFAIIFTVYMIIFWPFFSQKR